MLSGDYLQDIFEVFFLIMGAVEGDSEGLLGETQIILAEEVHLHLVMKHCGGKADTTLKEASAYLVKKEEGAEDAEEGFC